MEPWRSGLKTAMQGFSDQSLAERLEVSEVAVWRWRNGERWPDPGMLVRLCRVLGVTPNEIYGLKKVPRRPLPGASAAAVAKVVKRLDEARAILLSSEGEAPPSPQTPEEAGGVLSAIERAESEAGKQRKGSTRPIGRGSKR